MLELPCLFQQLSAVLAISAAPELSRFIAVSLGMIVSAELLLKTLNLDCCSVVVVSCL